MSNNNAQAAGSGNTSGGRKRERDPHAASPNQYNGTGPLPAFVPARSYSGAFDFEELIASLRDLFAYDRQVASQADNKRCGICYLYFMSNEVHYREEEGFYVCANCERTLGKQTLPMIRRQQK